MGYPRAFIVDPDRPGFYHCMTRCVRRAWLCGKDPISGRCSDHRRAWIEHRLLSLADSFAVGLYVWAVMSNHTHVVLWIDPKLPESWTDEEVARRWARLDRMLADVPEGEVEQRVRRLLEQPERLAELRVRLGSLSWFMRFLNECTAREANAEDRCSGRFWEGRENRKDNGAVRPSLEHHASDCGAARVELPGVGRASAYGLGWEPTSGCVDSDRPLGR